MPIKFKTNAPQTLTFPYGDYKWVQGGAQYGGKWQCLFSAEVFGERDSLYTSDYLKDKMLAAGLGSGAQLVITKVEGENGRFDWKVETVLAGSPIPEPPPPGSDSDTAVPQTPATASRPPQAPQSPQPQAQAPRHAQWTEEALTAVMQRSMDWAAEWFKTCTIGYTAENMEKVGVTLFMEIGRRAAPPEDSTLEVALPDSQPDPIPSDDVFGPEDIPASPQDPPVDVNVQRQRISQAVGAIGKEFGVPGLERLNTQPASSLPVPRNEAGTLMWDKIADGSVGRIVTTLEALYKQWKTNPPTQTQGALFDADDSSAGDADLPF